MLSDLAAVEGIFSKQTFCLLILAYSWCSGKTYLVGILRYILVRHGVGGYAAWQVVKPLRLRGFGRKPKSNILAPDVSTNMDDDEKGQSGQAFWGQKTR